MKLLITGASSILATRLVALLLKSEDTSIRLLEHRSKVKTNSCEVVSGDINNPDSLDYACQDMDEVLHLAALTHSRNDSEYFRVNRDGTQNLLNACKKNGVKRFLFVSSATASQYGGAYAVSKLESEDLVCKSGLEWIILRPSEVYGPQMEEGIGKLISWIENLKFIPVIGNGSYSMSPIYIDDVLDAMTQVVVNRGLRNLKLNICGPEIIPLVEIIDRLSQFLKVRRQKIFVPVWMAKLAVTLASALGLGSFSSDQIPRMLCEKDQDISQTSSLISYSPRKLEEGLSDYWRG